MMETQHLQEPGASEQESTSEANRKKVGTEESGRVFVFLRPKKRDRFGPQVFVGFFEREMVLGYLRESYIGWWNIMIWLYRFLWGIHNKFVVNSVFVLEGLYCRI